MSLSDLDLVAQAMAPTEPGAQQRTSNTNSNSNSNANTNSNVNATNAGTRAAPNQNEDTLAGIDLSTLTEADREALKPIMDALRASGAAGDGDLDIEGILAQMDAADGVADALEGRLDALLANLGELESAAAEKEAAEKREA